MTSDKEKNNLQKKQKKLWLIFYIILAFAFIFSIIDITIYLAKNKFDQQENQPININIQGATDEIKQNINNLFK